MLLYQLQTPPKITAIVKTAFSQNLPSLLVSWPCTQDQTSQSRTKHQEAATNFNSVPFPSILKYQFSQQTPLPPTFHAKHQFQNIALQSLDYMTSIDALSMPTTIKLAIPACHIWCHLQMHKCTTKYNTNINPISHCKPTSVSVFPTMHSIIQIPRQFHKNQYTTEKEIQEQGWHTTEQPLRR